MPFAANEVLLIVEKDESGWWLARDSQGREGYVPQNYVDNDATHHTLAKHTFPIPTTCDYCQEKIWSVTQKGLSCNDCGYNCHAKCELKVPPYCKTAAKSISALSSPSLSLMSSPVSPLRTRMNCRLRR